MRPAPLSVCMALLLPGIATAVTPNDFSQGIAVDAPRGLPMIELVVPDAVYQTATNADLSDLRVFNAEGVAVPHGFCAAPETTAAVVSEVVLPVFPLAPSRQNANSAHVDVQTAAGVQVRVEQSTAADERGPRVHIIDARVVNGNVRSIQFNWESPDGASEVRVSIQASEDLDRWTTVVPATTLLQVARDGRLLQRGSVRLPEHSYQYLRVERADGGPPLRLEAANAETVAPVEEIEPQWFYASVAASDNPRVLLFDTGRVAPVRYARLLLPQENSAFQVTFSSRADEKAPWIERYHGEIYLIATNGQRRRGPPARFAATTDRYWRVELQGESAVSAWPPLELGYRPLKLQFLAQGSGPYTLAFGSRRVESLPVRTCDELVAGVDAREREAMVAEAYPVGSPRLLGGEEALLPLAKKTPVRQLVLWSVLIAGVGLLVAMALSLIKRLTPSK